jgi:hypothetical protein
VLGLSDDRTMQERFERNSSSAKALKDVRWILLVIALNLLALGFFWLWIHFRAA